MQTGFDIHRTLELLKSMSNSIKINKDIKFQNIYELLTQLCYIFKELNTFLGIAFNDIKQKTKILQQNKQRFLGHDGVISFIKMQIKQNIHLFNGKNNSKLKANVQFKSYSSTSRNTLRIMWLLTFVRVMFQQYKNKYNEKLSTILGLAYDAAFGSKHSWMIRKSAKLAIYASPGVDRLMMVLLGNKDEEMFKKVIDQVLEHIIPIHQFMWSFYQQNKLVDLQ